MKPFLRLFSVLTIVAFFATGCDSITAPVEENTIEENAPDHVAALLSATGTASMSSTSSYTFPSTNDDNRDADLPHVNQLGVGIGEATLQFVNNTNSLAFFEYRIDGQVLTSGTAHPVVTGDFIYPGVCVDGRSSPVCGDGSPEVRTFTASEKVEVRLALGGERDWDFDWVTFEVLPDAQTKDDCKNGGWEDYGFRNQGACIQFVNTGKDSR